MTPTPLLPVRTIAPAEPLISVAAAKAHLRVLHSDEDTLIPALVAAAEAHLDGFAGVIGRALVTQSWRRSFDSFPCGDTIRLPLRPLRSITSVTYFLGGVSQTFDAASYHAITDALGPGILLASAAQWPTADDRPDAVTVTWSCGYGAAADVPASIVHAAKLLVGHFHANREAVVTGTISTDLQMTVDALIAPYRVVG